MSSVRVAMKAKPYRSRWWKPKDGITLRSGLECSDTLVRYWAGWGAYPHFHEEPHKGFDRSHGPWLVGSVSGTAVTDYIEYDPMATPGMHRRFAGLKQDVQAITAFANEFGFTGHPEKLRDPNDRERIFVGESLDEWIRHIAFMDTFIQLWDCVQYPDSSALDFIETVVQIPNRELNVSIRPPSMNITVELAALAPPEGLDRASSLVARARIAIEDFVSNCLQGTTEPYIEARPGSVVKLQPTILLGVIALQFAHEIMGETSPSTRCKACGRWFIPRHGRQIYCDDRCKFRGYRKRKKEESNG